MLPRLAAVLSVVLSLPFVLAGAAEERSATGEPGNDPFLEEVAYLITEEELAAYEALPRDYQRAAFRRAFWEQRDPYPETGRNEFQETWTARLELARAQLESLEGDRGRAFMLIGPPQRILTSPCPREMVRSEFWLYAVGGNDFNLLFVRGGGASPDGYRLWAPHEGLRSLMSWPSGAVTDEQVLAGLLTECVRGREAVGALLATVDWNRITEGRSLVPEPSPEWVATFHSRSTELPEGVATFGANFSIGYPARQRSRTVVQAIVEVPVAQIETLEAGGESFYRLQLDGEVLRKDQLFENFRYRYDFPVNATPGDRLPIAVERLLRPGTYRLAIKLRDLGSDRFFRMESEITVPRLPTAPASVTRPTAVAERPSGRPDEPLEAPASHSVSHPFREANRAARPLESHLRLLPLPEGVLTGRQRIQAIASTQEVAKVAFLLNGRRVMSKTRPPFSVEINLGEAPMVHTVAAVGYDKDGQEVARDQTPVNSGAQRFAVKLVEPQPGQRFQESLHARALVEVPRGAHLARVEFYLNETLLTTIYQEPFALPVRIPPSDEMAYLRVLAHLADGNFTEDLVFINAPEHVDSLQIDFVELYTSVVDKAGKPVQGLEPEAFTVLENGVEQEVKRFDRVADLPIHAAVLLDTSTSMEEEIDEAERAALKFFERVIKPRDRAAVISFADAPELRVPLTNSLEVLAGGLSGLVPEGETALFDSVVFGLYQLAGIRGKTALVLLSDGADTRSQHTQRQMLDYAARSGVAVYTIGLDIDIHDVESRSMLQRLARDTGGESFFIERANALDKIYAQIEDDLRSQYLLGYQSTGSDAISFRTVEVQVAVDGLRAKTVPGYYP